MSLTSALNVGVSALRAYSEGIQVVSNNIANVNTVGYKTSQAQYADTFANMLRPLVPNAKNAEIVSVKIPPTQVGGGVQIESIAPIFSQGTISITNSSSDLAIAGNGFFRVRDPQSGGKTFVTRAGNFRVDAEGYMVTQQGFRVQGSVGAKTKVVYDSSTGSFNVKASKDNAQVSIPADQNVRKLTGTLVKNSPDVTFNSLSGVSLQPGMPVTGAGIPLGTTVKSVLGNVVTLSGDATTAGNQSLSFYYKTIQQDSASVNVPPDYSRPTLDPVNEQTEVSGIGFNPGTFVIGASGNSKYTIPAALGNVSLAGVDIVVGNTVTPVGGTPQQNVTCISTDGLKKGMVVTIVPSPYSAGVVARVTDITDGTHFTVDQIATVDVSAGGGVAAGDKTLDGSSNVVHVKDLKLSDSTLIGVGMKASIEGVNGICYIVETPKLNSYGSYDLTLGDEPPIKLTGATSKPTGSTPVSKVLTLPPGVAATLRIGCVVSDQSSGASKIPAGTVITKITGDDITLSNSPTSDLIATDPLWSVGKAVYPVSTSYQAVRMAFNDAQITLSKKPTVDSYTAFSFALGTQYTSASELGDVKIGFSEVPYADRLNSLKSGYQFVDAAGNQLSAVDRAAAMSGVPKIRTFNVGTGGDINVVLSNGQTFTSGSVLLQTFRDPGSLIREGDNLFSGLETAGYFNAPEWDKKYIDLLTPAANGIGAINGGSLELSNVDLGQEFSTMITTQRAFQAGSRVITIADQMLEETVNLKR